MKQAFDDILVILWRELRIMWKNPMYGFCMVVFPLIVMFFFTTLMHDGLPKDMPVGVVDMDNTATTRSLLRQMDAFQQTRVVARYPSVTEARRAMQENEIYAFIYLPAGTTDDLLSQRQPKISLYFSYTSIASGSLLWRDLKTIATLGSAAVGRGTMRAQGFTDGQTMAALQPIAIDLHQVSNPWTNYNAYLSTMLIPGVQMLFIFLVTAYSLGMELKFRRNKLLMAKANNSITVAMIGKLLPQTIIWLILVLGYECYIYNVLHFPHAGGWWTILRLALMEVLASQGFGVFIFGLLPSLRMSMSVCSLWAVLSFSMCGAAFPVIGMDPPLQSLSVLFPLRHYYQLYQATVLNGFPVIEVWFHFAALAGFILLPITVWRKLKNAMLTYVYIP
ncbi:MAG: ABC transporter permease [Prevotella sp.]|nr:ABC transporter permease [Prevotella sp.]